MTFLFDNPATIVFAVVIAVWSVFFIEFWTRKQSELQFEWDTEDLDKNVQLVRPQFELNVKKTRKNPITGVNIVL
jgi:anoctamin-1